MKIFANNFAVCLTSEPAHQHFRFEGRSRREIDAWLRDKKMLFDGQVAAHYAEEEGLESLSQWVWSMLTYEVISVNRAQLNLIFPDETSANDFFEEISARFRPVTAAGGLVLDDEPALLGIFRDGKWDLPKGKVEKREDIAAAAWREVEEETGLQSHVTGEKACETLHVFPDRKGRWRLKTTHWFKMQCPSRTDLSPQTEEGITEVRWLPLAELRKEVPGTYPQIMELMRGVLVGS